MRDCVVRLATVDEDIAQLEKDIKSNVKKVKGLLKLRSLTDREKFRSHFDQALQQFYDTQDNITETQYIIERELALLNQIQAVVRASAAQQEAVAKLLHKMQAPDSLRMMITVRKPQLHLPQEEPPAATDEVDPPGQESSTSTKRSRAATPDNPELSQAEDKPTVRRSGRYTKDRAAFNKYIL